MRHKAVFLLEQMSQRTS